MGDVMVSVLSNILNELKVFIQKLETRGGRFFVATTRSREDRDQQQLLRQFLHPVTKCPSHVRLFTFPSSSRANGAFFCQHGGVSPCQIP